LVELPTFLTHTPVVPVVTLDDANQIGPLARALTDGGVPCAEITLRSRSALQVLEVAAAVEGFLAGAGTVLNARQAAQAVQAGAQFLVSPGLSREVVEAGRAAGVPVIPGIATATEVMAALDLGVHVVKFFPAAANGGPAALRALSAAFPQVRFMPTGGVNPGNLADYLAIPSVVALGGTWVADPQLVAARDYAGIARLAGDAVRAVANLRDTTTTTRTAS
jgi:2-dehydro-3-deoxyphosphogluconate aldolase / (4S)-4-hydroxy-2-oxoglutarate aldolase